MTLDITVDITNINIMPTTELTEIAQNVRMIIATPKFSVPLDREFGVSAAAIDDPISAAQAKLTAEISAAVRKYEPRARVKKIIYNGNVVDGQLNATVTIDIVEENLRGYV